MDLYQVSLFRVTQSEVYLSKFIDYLKSKSINYILVENCQIPTDHIYDLIHRFSSSLILHDPEGNSGFPGTAFFGRFRERYFAVTTLHQLKSNGMLPSDLSNVRFSVGPDGDSVQVIRICTDDVSPSGGMDLALYEVNRRTLRGSVLTTSHFYPISEVRLSPPEFEDDYLLVCGFPQSVDTLYGPSEVIKYPDYDKDGNPMDITQVIQTKVIIHSKRITDQTTTSLRSLELLCDGQIDVNGLSGSPVYHIGRRENGNASIEFSGIIARGSSKSKVMNFIPSEYLCSIIKSFVSNC